jgi:hypothetical protein
MLVLNAFFKMPSFPLGKTQSFFYVDWTHGLHNTGGLPCMKLRSEETVLASFKYTSDVLNDSSHKRQGLCVQQNLHTEGFYSQRQGKRCTAAWVWQPGSLLYREGETVL